jgi:hypothetical protein
MILWTVVCLCVFVCVCVCFWAGMKRVFSAIVLLISITCLPAGIHHEFLLIGLLIHEHSAQPGQAENPSFPLEPKNTNLGLHTFCW